MDSLNIGQQPDPAMRFARSLGIFFLVTGGVVLVALLVLVSQYLTDPESAFAVSMFADFLQSDAPPVTITIEGREAVLDIDSTFRVVLVVSAGALAIIAFGSIIQVCIGSGIRLLKFANGNKNDKNDKGD